MKMTLNDGSVVEGSVEEIVKMRQMCETPAKKFISIKGNIVNEKFVPVKENIGGGDQIERAFAIEKRVSHKNRVIANKERWKTYAEKCAYALIHRVKRPMGLSSLMMLTYGTRSVAPEMRKRFERILKQEGYGKVNKSKYGKINVKYSAEKRRMLHYDNIGNCAYNKFIARRSKELAGNGMPQKERVKIIAKEWNVLKLFQNRKALNTIVERQETLKNEDDGNEPGRSNAVPQPTP